MEKQQSLPILALQQQRLLLQMEYAAEKETFRKQTEEMGLQRKVKRGDAWYPVKMGKSYYNSLNQLVVEVFRQGEDDEIEHNFEFGKPLVFFRIGGSARHWSADRCARIRACRRPVVL